jgi:hypothetical protein
MEQTTDLRAFVSGKDITISLRDTFYGKCGSLTYANVRQQLGMQGATSLLNIQLLDKLNPAD